MLVIFVGVIISLVIGVDARLQGVRLRLPHRSRSGARPAINSAPCASIYGTLVTSFLAMLIAVPVGIGIAIFLTELCPRLLRRPIGIAIELLAGIPSIIYGIWGLFVFAPWFQVHVQQPIINALRRHSRDLGTLFGGAPYGIGIFTAGLILSIMILPFISAVTRDVLETVPTMLKEATYGLGCTTWEVMWRVVLPFCAHRRGGRRHAGAGPRAGRDHGGHFRDRQRPQYRASLFAPGTTISATIANEFTEATSPALHRLADRAGPDCCSSSPSSSWPARS